MEYYGNATHPADDSLDAGAGTAGNGALGCGCDWAIPGGVVMKFIQFRVASWRNEHGQGFTLIGLGEDGRLYKSIVRKGQHKGWVQLNDEMLPADYGTKETVVTAANAA